MERNAVLHSPSRIEELVKIFIHATKVRSTSLHTYQLVSWLTVESAHIDGDWILGDVSVCLMREHKVCFIDRKDRTKERSQTDYNV